MADVKVNVKVEPEINDKYRSGILSSLPIIPSLLNVRDDNDKTVITHSPPSKKAKVNIDMDYLLQGVVCLGESQQPITDVIHQEVSSYLVAAPCDTNFKIVHL
ncbi:hypothetical protein CHS0354_009789 [Potamilus streckersoni]|uniref:Uncharacterized protein n=1 Tax=Potamilus streckersoni TaxID=2493646 RepID=A0AAE0VZC9_9BIVA|nr:hypothetical protein CHS0354_009789 [Potamilus streckersoni]